jgi:hypothetical protein
VSLVETQEEVRKQVLEVECRQALVEECKQEEEVHRQEVLQAHFPQES